MNDQKIYDVEMTGKLGHGCHVFVWARNPQEAEKQAQEKFPELQTTGHTRLSPD